MENKSDQDSGHRDERVIADHMHTEIKPLGEFIYEGNTSGVKTSARGQMVLIF